MHEGYGAERGMADVRAAERRKKKAQKARERKKRRQRKKMTRGRVIGRPAKKTRADTATSSELKTDDGGSSVASDDDDEDEEEEAAGANKKSQRQMRVEHVRATMRLQRAQEARVGGGPGEYHRELDWVGSPGRPSPAFVPPKPTFVEHKRAQRVTLRAREARQRFCGITLFSQIER